MCFIIRNEIDYCWKQLQKLKDGSRRRRRGKNHVYPSPHDGPTEKRWLNFSRDQEYWLGLPVFPQQHFHSRCLDQRNLILELQSHFGDNPLKFQVVCPQIGTAVLKGLRGPVLPKALSSVGAHTEGVQELFDEAYVT